MSTNKGFKAYKAFNKDMTCRGFQFKEGETYTLKGGAIICKNGFHFCTHIASTLDYYPVNKSVTENRYAEVEVLGEVDFELPTKLKGCTTVIKIVRIIPDEEVEVMFDPRMNTGDYNTGNRNTGFFNRDTPPIIRVFEVDTPKQLWDDCYKPDFLHFNIKEGETYKEAFTRSFEQANTKDRMRITELPNFNADIFFEISGIDINKYK